MTCQSNKKTKEKRNTTSSEFPLEVMSAIWEHMYAVYIRKEKCWKEEKKIARQRQN
jgi:hypothetical protein